MRTISVTVDAKGQSCPGPLVELAKAIRDAKNGDVFELLATDPGAKSDVPAWAKLTGNELIEASEEDGGVLRYVIRKR